MVIQPKSNHFQIVLQFAQNQIYQQTTIIIRKLSEKKKGHNQVKTDPYRKQISSRGPLSGLPSLTCCLHWFNMAAANREIHSYHFGRKRGIVLDFTNLRKVLQQRTS